jgi:hypothetical protein
MTQEDKQFLLKDLCSRLPHNVICKLSVKGADVSITEKLDFGGLEHFMFGTMDIKPYLRPMSSMTDDEKLDYIALGDIKRYTNPQYAYLISEQLDYLNAHHFDYRGLIPMVLALEAPEGMYKAE